MCVCVCVWWKRGWQWITLSAYFNGSGKSAATMLLCRPKSPAPIISRQHVPQTFTLQLCSTPSEQYSMAARFMKEWASSVLTDTCSLLTTSIGNRTGTQTLPLLQNHSCCPCTCGGADYTQPTALVSTRKIYVVDMGVQTSRGVIVMVDAATTTADMEPQGTLSPTQKPLLLSTDVQAEETEVSDCLFSAVPADSHRKRQLSVCEPSEGDGDSASAPESKSQRLLSTTSLE